VESDAVPDLANLDTEELRVIVAKAAESHEDVARAVRLAAKRDSGDLIQLRAEIDGGLRTRQFLGYHESDEWALRAEPILEGIREAVETAPSAELVALIERAISHVVKTILHADDSNGLIGGLAHDLLDLHAEACDAGVADPPKLARWMVRFRFDDQDFFEADPVRYATALGEVGIAAYRREVDQRRQSGDDSFASKYAVERLATTWRPPCTPGAERARRCFPSAKTSTLRCRLRPTTSCARLPRQPVHGDRNDRRLDRCSSGRTWVG
jgi:hypothetical protein